MVMQMTGGMPLDQIAAVDPAMAQQIAQQAMDMAAQTYTLEELIYQTDYTIEASSSRRKDTGQQIESLNVDANSIWPLQLQSGDPRQMALAYDGMAMRAKLQGQEPALVTSYQKMAQDLRIQATLPPPPMPTKEKAPA